MQVEKKTISVSDMVRKDYRIADVFKKWGINYCCGGDMPLSDICHLQNLDQVTIQNDIEIATHTINISNTLRFDEWTVEFLVDYIVNVHHAYAKQNLPLLDETLKSFIQGHKKKYPYLEGVLEVFEELKQEVLEHTDKEEESIFPYFKQVSSTYSRKESYGGLFVRTLSKPFDTIETTEHKRIAALLMELRKATGNYTFAPSACTNHQVIYHKLKEFDTDLVQHKHLENNILFPKVRRMEQEMLQL